VPFVESTANGTFSLKQLRFIVVDTKYENAINTDGETLIPPTLTSFASTFRDDLSSALKLKVELSSDTAAVQDSIFMTIGNSSDYLDAAGRPSSEGYTIDVSPKGIMVTGASPLGAFWGTRSILQQGLLSEDMKLSLGSAIDAPGWGIRGTFVSVLAVQSRATLLFVLNLSTTFFLISRLTHSIARYRPTLLPSGVFN